MHDFGGKRSTTWDQDKHPPAPGLAPGKRTLVEMLPPTGASVQRKVPTSAPAPVIPSAPSKPDVAPRPTIFELFGGGLGRKAAAESNAEQIKQRAGLPLRAGDGEVGDAHERTADPDPVVRGGSTETLLDVMTGGSNASAVPLVDTNVEQLAPDVPSVPVVRSELASVSDGGRPLPDATRVRMERSFNADFSDVRLREGEHVAQMQAQAYADGAELHFAPGQLDPESVGGRELLGHELAHVMQQRAGRVATPPHKGRVIVDAGLEREADDLGHRAARDEIVVAPGARSLPAGAGYSGGIQGNFFAGKSYKVVPLTGTVAYEVTTNKPVNLVGYFLCLEPVPKGFKVMSYQDAKQYLVTSQNASDSAQWGDFTPSQGSSEYLPAVGPQIQHPKVEKKKSNKQNYDASGKPVKSKGVHQLTKFQVPAVRGGHGTMERSEFQSLKAPSTHTKKFMAPDQKGTGANRELMFAQNETDAMVEDVENQSLMGGNSTTQGATYCAYCLQWFEGSALDADHVMTWKAIGEWFDTVLVKMNTPGSGPTYVEAMRLQFKAQNLDFEKHFTKNVFANNKPWAASQMGAYYMFNNVKNLALSCKVCNQIEKNDMEWKAHLGKHAFFAKDFLNQLAPGDDHALVRNDGKYVAEHLREFNLTDPDNRHTIDSNRTVFKQSKKRTTRNSLALLANRNHEWDKAEGLIDKNSALSKAVQTVDDKWQSDGEDNPAEKQHFIQIGIEDALFFSDHKLEFDPRAQLEENEDLLERLDQAERDNRRLTQVLQRERAYRRDTERDNQDNIEAANQLYTENQQLREELASQKLLIEQQQQMLQMQALQMRQMYEQTMHMQHTGLQPIPAQSHGGQGFGSQGFGSQGFGSQGFGSQGFGNQGFGSQGFGNHAANQATTPSNQGSLHTPTGLQPL